MGVICSLGSKTCGACCWGASLSREEIAAKLRRHRDLFPKGRLPGSLSLLWHELRARRGLDVLLAPLAYVPFVKSALASWLREQVVCAFAAFGDGSETTVRCLLHPARHGGVDRRSLAFRLLASVGCGSPDYLCGGALRFESTEPDERRRFRIAVRELDWFDYSRAASGFNNVEQGGVTCRSSYTKLSI